jgi:hypothetical protein
MMIYLLGRVTAQDGNDDETVYMNLQFFGTIEPRLA